MAPIALDSLSSNWKKLQQTLQPSNSSTATKTPKTEEKHHSSLKRKRPTKLNREHAQVSSTTLNGSTKHTPYKAPASRKRQKMEEPPSIGSSLKHHDPKSLSRSISMPSLKAPSVLFDPETAAPSLSVLAPSPGHPDIENEGTSSTALPGKFIALDCEMVGTGPEPDRDSALARVSVVNYHGHQVYDSYVQVKVPVTDYRTAVSGISPKHLCKGIARPFKEVHSDISILLAGRILVGHSIKNDLSALQLKHEKRFIRDTSKYTKFRELANIPGRTPSLKGLVEKLLGVQIQVGAHSSVEDARATMALFRLEKEDFEAEIMKLYGNTTLGPKAGEIAQGAETAPKKRRNRRKKKN